MHPHEPNDYEGALGSEEHLWWLNVIIEEYESLMMHKTWESSLHPVGQSEFLSINWILIIILTVTKLASLLKDFHKN